MSDVFDDTEVEQPQTQEVEQEEIETEETGEEELETPSSETETEEEKFIPQHRFKAALNSANEKQRKIDEENQLLKARLAEYEQQKLPSREEDPEGWEIINRLEISRDMAREMYPDYDEKIAHYREMEAANPVLAISIQQAKNPAKMAYDLAKEDLEISKLKEVSKSNEWKEFQEWKKQQAKSENAETKINTQLQNAIRVPNLNKMTSIKRSAPVTKDDDVFAGSVF